MKKKVNNNKKEGWRVGYIAGVVETKALLNKEIEKRLIWVDKLNLAQGGEMGAINTTLLDLKNEIIDINH